MQLAKNSRKIILIAILLEFFIIALACAFHGFTLSGLQATTRFSGRLSLAFFSVIFVFQSKKKETLHRWVSADFYLVFAIVHGIHLVELLLYVTAAHIQLIPYRVAGGFAAYAFIFLMPWFEVRYRSMRMSPKKYAITVQAFLVYVWFIFFMSYLPRVLGKLPNVGGTFTEHVVLFSWVLFLLPLRFVTWFRTKDGKISTERHTIRQPE